MYEAELQINGLLQVVEVGTGALLTFYELYDLIECNYPNLEYIDRDNGERLVGFFQQIVIDKCPYPEDFFFCYLCRHLIMGPEKVGVGVFIDTKLKLKHRDPDEKLIPDVWPPIPGVSEFEEGD